MEVLTALLFALALSTDSFFVGTAYGIKRIRIPLVSLLVIVLTSALAVTVSMLCGKGLASILPARASSYIGAAMMLLIAVIYFFRACREKIASIDSELDEPLITLNIRSLGIIVQILRKPSSADFDASGEISMREACFLGTALAIDALGAGLGAAMAGLDIFLTAVCVGVVNFIIINLGLHLGSLFKTERLQGGASFLFAGIMFLSIGVLKLR